MANNIETLDVFHSFPLLPIETRKAIWEFSIDNIEPQTLSIQPTHAAVPPLLQTCKESRELCLKIFTLCESRQGDQVPRPCFYINFEKDTLYVNHILYPFVRGSCAFYNAAEKYPDWLSQVKFLALNILEANKLATKLWYQPEVDIYRTLGSFCPKLETLSVVMNGPIRRKININLLPCTREDFSDGAMAMMERIKWLIEHNQPNGNVVVGQNRPDENEVTEHNETNDNEESEHDQTDDDDDEEPKQKRTKDHEGYECHLSDLDDDEELIPLDFDIELVEIDMTAAELPTTENERQWLIVAEYETKRGLDIGEPLTAEEERLFKEAQ